MSKEVELVHLFKSSFDNCYKLSEQDPEDGLTLNQLFHEIKSITAAHGGRSRIYISDDKEYGMILTVGSEKDKKFHTYALNPPRSSTTSE